MFKREFMKTFLMILLQILILTMITFAQDFKTLIADGITNVPKKYDLQPAVYNLSKAEFEAVKDAAMEKEVEFKTNPQMSAEESLFKANFALLDVAEGFFIYQEIEFRAYLYSAYSEKIKRNYQGILVLNISNNHTKFKVAAHYVYEYRGDKYIRQLSDINGNILSEIAIFSESSTKKHYRKMVRIIGFSPDGLVKLGSKEIYSSIPQKQRLVNKANGQKSTHIYTPPIISAIKLYDVKNLGKTNKFYAEKWNQKMNSWSLSDKLSLTELDEDTTDYVEIFKPVFPKGPGEK